MEEIIRKYFTCWLNKDEKPLTDIFAEDIIYSECYGPEYHGIRQIQQDVYKRQDQYIVPKTV